MIIELRTEVGDLVRKVDIPERKKLPDAVLWGKRVFVLRETYKITGSPVFFEASYVVI